jgi:hypothetical protein
MCNRCQEFEIKIERYRRIMARFDDPEIVKGIGGLIEESAAEILALHTKQQIGRPFRP